MIAGRAVVASVALLAAGCGSVVWPEVRYVALGDSITGTVNSDTWPRFFVDLLDISEPLLSPAQSANNTVHPKLY